MHLGIPVPVPTLESSTFLHIPFLCREAACRACRIASSPRMGSHGREIGAALSGEKRSLRSRCPCPFLTISGGHPIHATVSGLVVPCPITSPPLTYRMRAILRLGASNSGA